MIQASLSSSETGFDTSVAFAKTIVKGLLISSESGEDSALIAAQAILKAQSVVAVPLLGNSQAVVKIAGNSPSYTFEVTGAAEAIRIALSLRGGETFVQSVDSSIFIADPVYDSIFVANSLSNPIFITCKDSDSIIVIADHISDSVLVGDSLSNPIFITSKDSEITVSE